MDNRFEKIGQDIAAEILRQDQKFGADNSAHPLVWQSILLEEIGEVAQEINDADFSPEELSGNYRTELIQVAAVAIQAVLNYDRDTVMGSCIGCGNIFYEENMTQDDAGENYCPKCCTHFKPILKSDLEQAIREGGIDPLEENGFSFEAGV